MGKVNENLYTMVRLRKDTALALRRIGGIYRRDYETGRSNVALECPDGEPSLDAIVSELIRRDDEHRSRGKAPRKPKDSPQS